MSQDQAGHYGQDDDRPEIDCDLHEDLANESELFSRRDVVDHFQIVNRCPGQVDKKKAQAPS